MPEQPQSLHTQSLKTKGKTYFFDVKEAKNGNKYLSITEARITDGQKFRSTITVFPENLDEFSKTIVEIQKKVK